MIRLRRFSPPPRQRGEAGYTLVEILAAMAITAIVAAVAVLSFPRLDGAPTRDPEVFAARVALAGQESVISGDVIGVVVTEFGLQFSRFRGGRWAWVSEPETLAARAWRPDVFVSVELEDGPDLSNLSREEIEALPPLIRLDPTGAATPARVRFDMDAGSVIVALGRNGVLTIDDFGGGDG